MKAMIKLPLMKMLKHTLLIVSASFFLFACNDLQKIADNVSKEIEKATGAELSTSEIVSGLKAALEKGTNSSVSQLSANGGFSKSIYRLAVPDKAKNVGEKLRQFGFGSLVDEFETKLNAAAESAVPAAKSIFINTVKGMSINDAKNILTGGNGAATQFFENKTRNSLYQAFYPKVSQVLDNSGTTKYWGDVVSNYNKLPGVTKVNADLNDYTSQKILDALFELVRKEENAIRSNPAERTTEILRKVFAAQD